MEKQKFRISYTENYVYSIDDITYKKLCDIPLLSTLELCSIQRLYKFKGDKNDLNLAIDLLKIIGEFAIADNLRAIL